MLEGRELGPSARPVRFVRARYRDDMAAAAQTSASGPRSGGYAKGRARRDQIIQAAIVLFGEVGYHAASLRDIAARSGISHPGLLHHFATKEDLLREVLEHRDAVDQADLHDDVAQGRSWLEAMLRLAQRNRTRRSVVELFAALSVEGTSPDHPAYEFFRARYAATIALATEAFEQLREDGGLRPGIDPAWAARSFVALWDGLQVQWLYSLTGPVAARVDIAQDLRSFVADLAPPPEAG